MFQLMIRAFNAPVSTLFKYESLSDAFFAARTAMDKGYHKGDNVSLLLGEGSLLSIMSDEAIANADKSDVEAKRSGGLVQSGRHEVKDSDFVLHIQFGMAQLPPLTYDKVEVRDEVLAVALKTRRITYIFEDQHDYFYIMLGSGAALFALTGKEFLDKRREAIAMHQKMLAAQQAKAQPQPRPGDEPRILIPLPFGRK